jgi:hypothetical protein
MLGYDAEDLERVGKSAVEFLAIDQSSNSA